MLPFCCVQYEYEKQETLSTVAILKHTQPPCNFSSRAPKPSQPPAIHPSRHCVFFFLPRSSSVDSTFIVPFCISSFLSLCPPINPSQTSTSSSEPISFSTNTCRGVKEPQQARQQTLTFFFFFPASSPLTPFSLRISGFAVMLSGAV